ncbi:hypothetical protein ABIC01_008573 [Bradyrhizobium sp. RT4b]
MLANCEEITHESSLSNHRVSNTQRTQRYTEIGAHGRSSEPPIHYNVVANSKYLQKAFRSCICRGVRHSA